MTTATLDQPTTETTTKPKAKRNITAEQKRASSLRRDAAMLERMAKDASDPAAILADAAKYRSQADQLSPITAKVQSAPRPICAFVHDDGDGNTHRCGSKATRDGQFCFAHTDALSKLSEAEWQHVEGYFINDLRRHLLEGFSWRALKNIASPKQATTS